MSQHSFTCIQQLDLAITQLEEGSPSYARFALILIDNIVELLIHKYCEHIVMMDEHSSRWLPAQYSVKQREDARGQRFDRKVKLCKFAGKFTDDQAAEIIILHQYRNEQYHTGLTNDDVIWDLAWHYHQIATKCFVDLVTMYSLVSSTVMTPAVEKHAGKNAERLMMRLDEIAESLNSSKPPRRRKLQVALSELAIKKVEDMEYNLDFLVTNDPNERPELECVVDLQFYDYLHGEELPKLMWGKVKTPEDAQRAMAFLKNTWTPKYSTSPLSGFRAQAKKMASCKNEVSCLKSFEKFKADINYFEGILEREAIALDGHIQQQIDEYRGK